MKPVMSTDLAGADGEYPDFLGLNSRFGGVDTTDSAALCFPLVGVVVTCTAVSCVSMVLSTDAFGTIVLSPEKSKIKDCIYIH